MNDIVYSSKQKKYQISLKKNLPLQNIYSPPSNVYYMEFYRNFLFEYSLIGIVKLKSTRSNEIWYRIWEMEDLSKNVRKKQDRTSLRFVILINSLLIDANRSYFSAIMTTFQHPPYSETTVENIQFTLPNSGVVTYGSIDHVSKLIFGI